MKPHAQERVTKLSVHRKEWRNLVRRWRPEDLRARVRACESDDTASADSPGCSGLSALTASTVPVRMHSSDHIGRACQDAQIWPCQLRLPSIKHRSDCIEGDRDLLTPPL